MVRFAMQALGADSPHQRPTKRSRSEPLVELPTSPPLPLSLQEQEHQSAATFDPDTLDCQICMEALSAPIFQIRRVRVPEDAQVHKEERPRDLLPLHAFQVSRLRLHFLRSCQILPRPLPGVSPNPNTGISIRHLVHSCSKPDRSPCPAQSRQHGVPSPPREGTTGQHCLRDVLWRSS